MRPDVAEESEPNESGPKAQQSGSILSYGMAMTAFAVLGTVCAATLRGDALYIALLIVGALALKTWLARVKSRIE